MRARYSARLSFAAWLLLVAGCAGSRVEITARNSRYPISFSHLVRDRAGYLYDRASLDAVGTFNGSKSSFGIFYSALGLSPRYDVSDDVNRQVARAGGEAVVDTTVSVTTDCNALNAFPILNAIPIWPGCVHVVVSGAIVRRRSPTRP